MVTDVKSNTYYASIYLSGKQSEVTVDSRPSDAIALALRTNSPIFATREVLERQGPETVDPWLKNLDTKGFGGAA